MSSPPSPPQDPYLNALQERPKPTGWLGRRLRGVARFPVAALSGLAWIILLGYQTAYTSNADRGVNSALAVGFPYFVAIDLACEARGATRLLWRVMSHVIVAGLLVAQGVHSAALPHAGIEQDLIVWACGLVLAWLAPACSRTLRAHFLAYTWRLISALLPIVLLLTAATFLVSLQALGATVGGDGRWLLTQKAAVVGCAVWIVTVLNRIPPLTVAR